MRDKWRSPDFYRFKFSASPGSEATQKMSSGTSSLAATCLMLAYLYVGVGFQGVVRVSPAEFIRPKQTMI